MTDTSFRQEVLESPLLVLLDCWAPWCYLCLMMAPVIEELARSLAGTLRIAKLDVDENPETAGRLGIRSIPTMVLFRDGRVIGEMIGAASRAEVESAVLRRLREH